MKVDRVILVSDNNSLYYSFWDNLSKTYKEKFNINPTLIFFGTKKELKTDSGEIEKELSRLRREFPQEGIGAHVAGILLHGGPVGQAG